MAAKVMSDKDATLGRITGQGWFKECMQAQQTCKLARSGRFKAGPLYGVQVPGLLPQSLTHHGQEVPHSGTQAAEAAAPAL